MSTMYSTGYNGKGQLGVGDNTARDEFTQAGTSATWSFVTSGWLHSLAIKSDDTLWSTGDNFYGQLGLNNSFTENENEFTRVNAVSACSTVAGGNYHSLAVKTDGTLWATGQNGHGQLGLGATSELFVFTKVGSLTTWSSVSCGREHSAAVKTDGTLWVTGKNGNGQLGLGDTTERDAFTQVGALTTWASVVCGNEHTMAVKTDGTLWATGINSDGRLGLGDTAERDAFTQVGALTTWDSVSCGITHSMAVRTDGTLWATGAGPYGQLGLGETVSVDEFTQVGGLSVWGSVACGHNHTMAIKTDGVLWATGYNYSGQLGLDDTTDRDALTQSGTLKAGSVAYGGGNHAHMLYAPQLGRHRGIVGINGGVLFNEKTIIGDSTGNLYALNMNTYTDAGQTITRVRRTQIVSDDDINILHRRVEVEFEAGVGLSGGDDPEATLKWSDDGGDTFSEGEATGIGEYDDWGARAVWRSLGKSRDRIYELTISAAVKVVIIGAYSILKKCRF